MTSFFELVFLNHTFYACLTKNGKADWDLCVGGKTYGCIIISYKKRSV